MFRIVLIAYLAASVVTFVAYGLDKRAARSGRRRMPERTLHVMALCGGWPGALAGQQLFRHKRRKTRFMVTTGLIVAVHLVVWVAAMWDQFGGNQPA